MNLHLKGKSVIVTAASKGLGKAIAMEFAKEGAHVLISSRNEEALQSAVKEMKMETGSENVDYAIGDIKTNQTFKNLLTKLYNGTAL